MNNSIKREIIYKNILFEKFGYYGGFPFSKTVKQLDTLCEVRYRKKLINISKVEICHVELLELSKIRNMAYAYRFLKAKSNIYERLKKLEIVLFDYIISRILLLEVNEIDYILQILEKYNTENCDIISDFEFVFKNEIMNFEIVSILVDIFIEPLMYIDNLMELLTKCIYSLPHLSQDEKKKIHDYFDDKTNEFSRIDFLNEIIYNSKNKKTDENLFDKFINLESYDYFQCKEFLICLKGKSQSELCNYLQDITNSKINKSLKNILLDYAINNIEEEIIIASLNLDDKYPLNYYYMNYTILFQYKKDEIELLLEEWKDEINIAGKRKRNIDDILIEFSESFKKMKIQF